MILIGSSFIAIGVNVFLLPNSLMEGGALGISLLLHYLQDVEVGKTFLAISVPIFLVAWFLYRPFFYNGLHGMLCSSLFIDLFHPLTVLGGSIFVDPIIEAAIGGFIIGTGVGLMLSMDVSIGGTDLLAQMIANKISINPAFMIFFFDSFIVVTGSYLLSGISLLHSIVTVLCVGLAASFIASRKVRVKKF
ncbi:YitT family protein [Sporosarcina saromensis]|uniref:YitT family protein n=2 Tax=Sporosarcina saromensis TaxID=359365 RepID=A0ABU4G8Y9_9BACL|nr:YitT family protein [Sporosarcina saromensis]